MTRQCLLFHGFITLLFSQVLFSGVGYGQDNTGAASPPPPSTSAATVEGSATSTCIPSCRSGYVCYQRMCIAACNPPCEPGQQCIGDGQCVTVNPAMPSQSAPAANPSIVEQTPSSVPASAASASSVPPSASSVPPSAPSASSVPPSARAAVRMHYREAPRFTVGLLLNMGMLGDPKSSVSAFALLPEFGFGFRKNFLSSMGVWVEAGIFAGAVMVENNSDPMSTESDATYARGVRGEMGLYGGPFAHIYIGPLVGVIGIRLRDNTLNVGDPLNRDNVFFSDDTAYGLYGVKGGLLLGKKEQVNLFFKVMSSFSPNKMPVLGSVGISIDTPAEL